MSLDNLNDMWRAAGCPERWRPAKWLAFDETARFRAHARQAHWTEAGEQDPEEGGWPIMCSRKASLASTRTASSPPCAAGAAAPGSPRSRHYFHRDLRRLFHGALSG